MTRIYMRADENGAGVTVEESASSDELCIEKANGYCVYVEPAEFRAVIEGGLRWMLENAPGPTNYEQEQNLRDFVESVIDKKRTDDMKRCAELYGEESR